MPKSITFKSEDVSNFVSWLKKFSSIESSLLLEINKDKQSFVAKSYNSEKSVVKLAEISFENAGLHIQKEFNEDLIKLGIFNILQMIKSFEQFKSKAFDIIIKYDEVDESFAGTSILIKNDSLRVKIECTSLNIFKYISDELYRDVIMNTTEIANLEYPLETIEEILSLSVLDKDYKFLEFLIKDGKVFVKGRTFALEIADAENNKNHIISVYKEHFEKVDKENYNFVFGDDKLIFKSKDSETITVLSMVVKDYEKYDEELTDFE